MRGEKKRKEVGQIQNFAFGFPNSEKCKQNITVDLAIE